MSNPVVKKVVIKKEDLPALNGVSQNYLVRYRVVSEDRNRTSHWSAYYKVDVHPEINRDLVPPEPWISHSVVVSENKQVINLVWTAASDLKPEFDIYVKWGQEEFKYLTSVQTSSYSLLNVGGYDTVMFAVQVPTFPKKRFTKATLLESDPVSLVV